MADSKPTYCPPPLIFSMLSNECLSAVKEYNLKRLLQHNMKILEFRTRKVRVRENQRLNHIMLKITYMYVLI